MLQCEFIIFAVHNLLFGLPTMAKGKAIALMTAYNFVGACKGCTKKSGLASELITHVVEELE